MLLIKYLQDCAYAKNLTLTRMLTVRESTVVEKYTLHRASWIVPVATPVLADGGIIVKGSRIVDVGPYSDLHRTYPDVSTVHHEGCVLTPPLINAHIHLELSHLLIPAQKLEVKSFTDWIPSLLDARDKLGATGKDVEDAARKMLDQQHKQGVAVLGDIGNTDIGEKLKDDFPGIIVHFLEFLGSSPKMRRAVQKQIEAIPDSRKCTAHAPYTTHAELITLLKNRANKSGHPFPVHVAEPDSENEMLSHGTGELFAFLNQRGFLESPYRPPAAGKKPGSVHYLHTLGVLDNLTICVHCIHVSEEEIALLAETGTRVCLCPGSNRYLHVGSAPAQLFLKHGILPALGTDSAASNPEISIWREMRLLSEDNPEIDPADIFNMATLGGATALGVDDLYGTLAPGKSARFLALSTDGTIDTPAKIYEFLVRNNHQIQPDWVHE